MAFDADAAVEALTPPSFKSRGRLYLGRVLSVEEWTRLLVLRAATQKDGDLAAMRSTIREFVTSWFPAPWWIRPLAVAVPSLFHPAFRAFARLPDKVQTDLLRDFSASQWNAMPETAPSQPSGTTENPTRAEDEPQPGI